MKKYELISRIMGKNQKTSFAILRAFEGLWPIIAIAMKYEIAEIASTSICAAMLFLYFLCLIVLSACM